MCEGVGENSRHGIGHVDIQVGSCIYLSVIVCMTCALRWGVTYLGNYHYWVLLTMSRDHYFKYREYKRMTLTRGRVLEESRVVALVFVL